MRPDLLPLLCDPKTKQSLSLTDETKDDRGHIISGTLTTKDGKTTYPIIDGVPRFVPQDDRQRTVDSFGDQWNFFNFDFHEAWLNHGVKHTLGSPDAFKGKTVIDAGAGSGMQSKWIAEAGAEHVIALELSHSVDGIIKQNLEGKDNVDVIQCSIDNIPLKDQAIEGFVTCYNVIQHTPSVEKTAKELWRITGKKGTFMFNCYTRTDEPFIQRLRYKYYKGVRAIVSHMPFWGRLTYARTMSVLRFIPLLGWLLEKSIMMVRGDIPAGPKWISRAYRAGVVNTFDYFGAHKYQAHLSFDELQALADELQPAREKQTNRDSFFTRPQPIGIMLKIDR